MTEPAVWSPAVTLMNHHRDTANEILQCIAEGTYCTLLGPHFSGKTMLVHSIEAQMVQNWQWPCVYVDLHNVKASTQRGFFASLTNVAARRLEELTGLTLSTPDALASTGAAFRGFLADAVLQMRNDLVLLIDHLEALPTDLAQALLTSLRAAYMEQQTLGHRLVVVASGALSLATLTVGESSPFRGIARRIFVGDLTEKGSEQLIGEFLSSDGLRVSPAARQRLAQAARGDPHLIRRICEDSAQAAGETTSRRLTVRTVDQAVQRFLDHDVFHYAPLLEAMRAIEDNPDLLHCILLLLQHGTMPRAELPLPLSPDIDPLVLSGVVETVDKDRYRLRNEIYHRFLAQRLDPGRVGHLLTVAGRWDSAIDYLEASVGQGNEQYRIDLLPATIHSIYASEDMSRAAHFLLRGLSAAFGIHQAQVWMASAQVNCLRLVGQRGLLAEPVSPLGHEIGIAEDRLEARAYREANALRGEEDASGVSRAMPLVAEGRRPIGVVSLRDRPGERLAEQREREQQLMGYLNQAARAVQQVFRRTQELALAGHVQAGLLPPVPDLPGWQLAAALHPARVMSGDFYDFIPLPNARLGIVIADVTDKGLGAALYMALSRTLIRTYAEDAPDQPAQVLGAASRRMLQDAHAGLFVSAFYGILDSITGQLTYCNAGQHPPLLLSAQEQGSIRELSRTGMALGAVVEADWKQETVRMQPGDTLLLYTDGVPDAQNRQRRLFGQARIPQILEASQGLTASEVQQALLAAIHDFVGEEPQFDDIALVVVRREEREVAVPGRERPPAGRHLVAM